MPLSRPKISPFAILIGGAILLGILVAWLVIHTLHAREAAAAAALRAKLQKNQVTVVVPVRNLKAGTIANSSDMAARAVPRTVVYPNTITADSWGNYVGRILTHPAYKGRPLLRSDFGPVASASFANSLPPGERAFTINISGVNSIAHLIEPGNLIDLLLLAQGPQGEQLLPLLHHVRVIAVGPRTVPTAENQVQGGAAHAPHYTSLTLALTPGAVAKLALAEQVGTLRVALVPQHRPLAGPIPNLVKADLFPAVPSAAPSLPTIQYIIGRPGRNAVQEVPVSQPLPRAATPETPAAPATEAKAMAALMQQIRQRVAASAPPPAPALPKGYP